jgi:hypothetical protein
MHWYLQTDAGWMCLLSMLQRFGVRRMPRPNLDCQRHVLETAWLIDSPF